MKCFVSGCTNSWRKGKKPDNISFHKFPKLNYKVWLDCLGVDSNLPWPQHSKICSLHFAEDCFIRTGPFRIRLKPNSLPINQTPMSLNDFTVPDNKEIMDSSTETLSSPEILCISDAQSDIEGKTTRSIKRRLLDLSSRSTSSSSTNSSGMKKKVKLIQTFHNYSSSLERIQANTSQIKNRTRKIHTKYHNLKKTVKRLNRKVQSLSSVVNILKKKQLVSNMASEHLSKSFSVIPNQLMTRILKTKRSNSLTRSKYPPELKDFAMTLLFYSKKGYDFVRKTFDFCLPHPATIRKIYSGIECRPGFTGSSFDVLKLKADEYRQLNKELICSLIIDEMAIKKEVISDGQTSYGYIDIGNGYFDDLTEPATEVLLFLVVCLTEHWKLPIAYFLIKSLNGKEKANLVNEALIRLDSANVKITSITCDGPTVNMTMLMELGCRTNFDGNDQTYFPHPNDKGARVYAILDACHMLKLMRNALSELGHFYDDENKLIEWRYIEMLYDLENTESLSAGTKIRKSHMEWQRQKMKVRLAAQTLSSSVADALEFLMKDMKLPQFRDAGPTIRFIRTIDRSFDILNSRSPVAKGYKAPLRTSTCYMWEPCLKNTIEYLRKCTLDGAKLMTLAPRKTPFIGFIISLSSTIGIFDEYVKSNRLQYLLTYKYSQDHIELFFCSVRSHNGWNNNPNALQFQHTYKRLLFHAQVKGVGGNCEAIDSTTILSLPSNKSSKYETDTFKLDFSIARKYNVDIVPEYEDHDYDMVYSPSLSEYSENVVTYISGYVIRMVRKRLKCPECLSAIQDVTKSSESLTLNLIRRKDRGSVSSGLLWPSEGLIVICMKCEIHVRRLLNITNNKVPKETGYIDTLANSISQIYYSKNIFPLLENHFFEYEFNTNHVYLLIKTICSCYLKIRFFNLSKKQTEVLVGRRIRHTFNKLILFNNQ